MARPGLRSLNPERYEPALRARLLAADPDDVTVGRALFDVLRTTPAEPLWRAVGARLAACAQQQALVEWSAHAWAEDVPRWRLQPLCHDPTIAGWLLADLGHRDPRVRVAACKALAPRVHEPAIRSALLACLQDPHMHVCSTAIEVLRPGAGAPEVRDALLTLYRREGALKACIDRALRRSLRAAAGDPEVQAALLVELRGQRPWLAAEALRGASGSEALADALLAVLVGRRSYDVVTIWPAFVAVARVGRVTAAFLPLLADVSPSVVQKALRIVGLADSEAALAGLLAALEHPENYVRWGALEQLVRHIGRPAVREAVRARLGDADDGVRMYAVQALAGVDDPALRGELRGMFADPSPAVAIAAAGAVARETPDPAAWEVLAPHVDSQFSAVYTKSWQPIDARAQVGTLVVLGPVRDALARGLDAFNPRHRAAAARVLRGSPASEAIADRLATCVLQDEPIVAGEAYATLAAWTAADR